MQTWPVNRKYRQTLPSKLAREIRTTDARKRSGRSTEIEGRIDAIGFHCRQRRKQRNWLRCNADPVAESKDSLPCPVPCL
jgi:hypothetical protein